MPGDDSLSQIEEMVDEGLDHDEPDEEEDSGKDEPEGEDEE